MWKLVFRSVFQYFYHLFATCVPLCHFQGLLTAVGQAGSRDIVGGVHWQHIKNVPTANALKFIKWKPLTKPVQLALEHLLAHHRCAHPGYGCGCGSACSSANLRNHQVEEECALCCQEAGRKFYLFAYLLRSLLRPPSARTGNEPESSSALADGGGRKGLRWMSVMFTMSFLICVLLCTKLCGRAASRGGGVLACGAQSETFRSFLFCCLFDCCFYRCLLQLFLLRLMLLLFLLLLISLGTKTSRTRFVIRSFVCLEFCCYCFFCLGQTI